MTPRNRARHPAGVARTMTPIPIQRGGVFALKPTEDRGQRHGDEDRHENQHPEGRQFRAEQQSRVPETATLRRVAKGIP